MNDMLIPNATKTLATYAAGLDVRKLPGEVVQQAKIIFFDTVAILLASSTRSAVNTALRAMPPSGKGQCTVVGHGTGASPDLAAFINGIGGHDIELDDSHSPSRTHAAAVIVPAALAAAEVNKHCSGADLLAGIIAAYDVQARVSKAMGVQSQFDHGFHPTAVCGNIGAAVCAGRILGLSPEIMAFSIGLATSQSCGLTTFEDDESHMLKSFHTGVAARNGMTAALLAAHGYKSSPDALTGPHNVLAPFGGDAVDFARLTEELGERFEICGTSIKRHACCGQTHSAVDSLLALMQEHALSFKQIERIDVELAHKALPIVDANPLWTHNIQYVLALAAHQGYIGVQHFSPEWTGRREIAELARKVHAKGNDRLQRRFPVKKAAIVTITACGSTYTRELDSPIGNPTAPLTPADLRAKFMSLATEVLKPRDAEMLWSTLSSIDTAPNLDGVFPLLCQKPQS